MFVRTLLVLCPVILLAQTPPPAPAPPAPPAVAPAAPPAPPEPAPDKVILTIGDLKITYAMYSQILDTLPAQMQAMARAGNRQQYADMLVKIFVLSQEGKRRKLDETPSFKIQTMFQSSNLLAGKAYEELGKEGGLSEAEMRKYFDEHKDEFEQIKARHILIRMAGSPMPLATGKKELSEEEALAKITELRKKLAAGEPFDSVAQYESDDRTSGSNGGQLGTFRRHTMVPPFEEAAFKLKVGELSEPVKTPFGYHLITVDERLNSFDDAKEELEKRLKPEMQQKAVSDLVKKANPVFDPEFFGTPKK